MLYHHSAQIPDKETEALPRCTPSWAGLRRGAWELSEAPAQESQWPTLETSWRHRKSENVQGWVLLPTQGGPRVGADTRVPGLKEQGVGRGKSER